jgi:Flp pilus assembly protein TadB
MAYEDEENEENEEEEEAEEEVASAKPHGARITGSLRGFERNTTYKSGVTLPAIVGLLVATILATYFLGVWALLGMAILSVVLIIASSVVFVRPMERGFQQCMNSNLKMNLSIGFVENLTNSTQQNELTQAYAICRKK